MTIDTKIPLSAETVAKARRFIETRFQDTGGYTFPTLRSVAHDVLDKLMRGDYVGANAGIQSLRGEAACDMRAKLRQLGIDLEIAA